jgi:transcriptional regulator with XRE-family HTH domain
MNKETFGQRFQRLRKQKGLTQEQIAERVNISPQAVSKWENDLTAPDINILLELSEILGVTVDILLGKVNEVETTFSNEKPNYNKLLLKIKIISNDGDKVNINLPFSLIKVCVEKGLSMPSINGNEALKEINLNEIFNLIEQGVLGKIVDIQSSDGSIIEIIVE